MFGSLELFGEPHQLLFIICSAVWDGKLWEIKKIKIFFLFVNRGKKTEWSKGFIVHVSSLKSSNESSMSGTVLGH